MRAVAPMDRYTQSEARSCLRLFTQAFTAPLKLRLCGAIEIQCPHPHRADTLSIDDHCLSVCRSVCPIPDPKSRTEGCSKLKVGRKEAHDTGDP